MLTPYAVFDPETGFFLPPDEMLVDSSQAGTDPAELAIDDNPETPAQGLDTNSNITSFSPILLITALVIFSIAVTMGIRKLTKKLE